MNRTSGTWLPAILLAVVLGASSCSSGHGGGGSNPTEPGGGTGSGPELNSGSIAPGSNFEHRFATAGTFAYHCIFHGPMTGSVVVSASATDTLATVTIISSTTPFPGATVKPGGRVVWTNSSGMTHTVTSN